MPTITFKNKLVVQTEKGTSILEAALENSVPLFHTCGGNASCSTCRVKVLSGEKHLTRIESAEAQVLEAFDLKPPHRLGCQALVLGDVEIEIPDRDKPPRPNKTPEIEKGRNATY